MSNYKFDIPAHHKSIIKVIGVGGGGSNAVTHMFGQGIKDVEFVIINTDSQALKASPVATQLQIGVNLTEGLGAGANPEVGRNAAIESKEEIREMLSTDTKMVFITAGMGGGTGTGAAPVIAAVAKELGVLTVGIVTAPFSFEGKKKMQFANDGINYLKENCDTVLVISNDKLRDIHGNLTIRDAFSKADNVLSTAAKSIAEIITVTSEVNVDFEDVKTVMSNSGAAVMGSAIAEGENRARRAVEDALSSPLLDNTEIEGAKKILLSITYGEEQELTMDELTDITDYIEDEAGSGADVIFGQGVDPTLGAGVRVTIIATGFQGGDAHYEKKPTVFDLETSKTIERKEEQSEAPRKVNQPVGNHYKNPEQRTSHSFTPNVENGAGETPRQEQKRPETNFQQHRPESTEGQEKKVIFKIDGDYEVTEKEPEEPFFTPEKRVEPGPAPVENLDEKRRVLDQQARERVKRLKGLSSNGSMDPEEFKERLEVPAYKRKNVNLKDVPHSSDSEVSRYNLNDDNEILGNNKFLHDNVD